MTENFEYRHGTCVKTMSHMPCQPSSMDKCVGCEKYHDAVKNEMRYQKEKEDFLTSTPNISSDALKLDTTLIRSITGAIKNHIRFNGPVKVQDTAQLCNRIMGSLEGIINDAMVSEFQRSIDTDKYVVIEKAKLDRILERDKSKQIKYLVERLKEVDPEFKQRNSGE